MEHQPYVTAIEFTPEWLAIEFTPVWLDAQTYMTSTVNRLLSYA